MVGNIQQHKLVTDNLKDLHFNPVQLVKEINTQKRHDRHRSLDDETVNDYKDLPKLSKETETTPTKALQSSSLADAFDFNPVSTLDSQLGQSKKEQ